MPTSEDRAAFKQAIQEKDSVKIRELLQRDDAKELMLMVYGGSWLPIHEACCFKVDEACLQLILDTAVEHGIIKKMLEEKTKYGRTCLHFACANQLSPDSLRILLEFMSKYADIQQVLQDESSHQIDDGANCLHRACHHNLSPHSLRLLVSFSRSNESLQLVLDSKNNDDKTPLAVARNDEHKELLQDPDCWQKCRYWLFCNHQDTFLNSLYPKSPERTLEDTFLNSPKSMLTMKL